MIARILAVAGVAAAGSGCGASRVLPTYSMPVPAPASGLVCGFRSGPPKVDKVLVIWEENKDYGSIVGSSQAPELNAVAARCGLATDAEALTHPSLPNYLTETSGLSYARSPFNGDCSPGGNCVAKAPSVFSEEASAGQQWRAYVESMPRNCDQDGSGLYAPRHNPAVYYPAISSQCALWDLPLGLPGSGPLATAARDGTLPALTTVTPNLEDDMHDGSVAQADTWLRIWLPVLTAGPDYRSGRLAILIVWDEGSGSGNSRSHIPLLVLAASTPPGTRSATPYDDNSVLATIEDLTGIPHVDQDNHATALVTAFRL